MYLGHNHDFFPRELELLDGLPEDDFGEPIRIDLLHQEYTVSEEMRLRKNSPTNISDIESLDPSVVATSTMYIKSL